MNRVFVLVGPTAVGKSACAVELAHLLDGEVVSSDSMQIYKKMDIGTAKPSIEEKGGIPHHLIDIVEPDEAYSVAVYQQQAKQCIRDILGRGKVPILAGGTGLYINSITYNLDFSQNNVDLELRDTLNSYSAEGLYQMLRKLDAKAAGRIHPNNKKRVIRAIEIAKSMSRGDYNFQQQNDEFDFSIFGLACGREALYNRINSRVDKMIDAGLVAEVKMLYNKYGGAVNSMQAIGYKELCAYFEKNSMLPEAVSAIKQNTRRFAKRQMTWFRRDDRMIWFDISMYTDPMELAKLIIKESGT